MQTVEKQCKRLRAGDPVRPTDKHLPAHKISSVAQWAISKFLPRRHPGFKIISTNQLQFNHTLKKLSQFIV